MADIDVVHRKSSSTWMWWVLAAVLVLALVFLLTRSADREDGTGRRSSPGSSLVTPQPSRAA